MPRQICFRLNGFFMGPFYEQKSKYLPVVAVVMVQDEWAPCEAGGWCYCCRETCAILPECGRSQVREILLGEEVEVWGEGFQKFWTCLGSGGGVVGWWAIYGNVCVCVCVCVCVREFHRDRSAKTCQVRLNSSNSVCNFLQVRAPLTRTFELRNTIAESQDATSVAPRLSIENFTFNSLSSTRKAKISHYSGLRNVIGLKLLTHCAHSQGQVHVNKGGKVLQVQGWRWSY